MMKNQSLLIVVLSSQPLLASLVLALAGFLNALVLALERVPVPVLGLPRASLNLVNVAWLEHTDPR